MKRRDFLGGVVGLLTTAAAGFGAEPLQDRPSLRSDQIHVPDTKIEAFYSGRLVPVASGGNDPEIDGLLKENGAAGHMKQIVRDLAASMKITPPDIILTNGSPTSVSAAKIGDRNVIVISRQAMGELSNVPADKKWAYLESEMAHEMGHLRKDALPINRVLDQIHPANQPYMDDYYSSQIAQTNTLFPGAVSPQDAVGIVERAQQRLESQRTLFASELAQIKPLKLHLPTQNEYIREELVSDKVGALATGNPAMMDEVMKWKDQFAQSNSGDFDKLAKEGLLDHPYPQTRSAHMKYMENQMQKDKPPEPAPPAPSRTPDTRQPGPQQLR